MSAFKLKLLVVCAVALTALTTARTAEAWRANCAGGDYACYGTWTYDSDVFCIWQYVEASNGSHSGRGPGGGGFTKGQVNSNITENYQHTYTCHSHPTGFPRYAGQMNVHIQYWKLFRSTGKWQVCRDFPRVYSTTNGLTAFIVYHDFGGSNPPCGEGWYGTLMTGYVYDGGWLGGRLWSGINCIGICPNFTRTAADVTLPRPTSDQPTAPPSSHPPMPPGARVTYTKHTEIVRLR